MRIDLEKEFSHALRLGFLGSVLFAVLILYTPHEGPAQSKWFILSIISAVFTANFIRKYLGWPAALLLGYCIVNAAWFWIWRDNRYLDLCVLQTDGKCFIDPGTKKPMQDVYTQLAIRHFAADGLAKLLLVIPLILFFLKDRIGLGFMGRLGSSIFCLANSGLVYFTFFFSGHWCQPTNSCGGSISNPSMNSCMIVVSLPFVIEATRGWLRYTLIAFVAGAVLLSKGSIGMGLLAALAVMYAVRFKWWKLLSLAPLSLIAGYLLVGPAFLSSGDRVQAWEFFMVQWANSSVHWAFGTGYGTFAVLARILQAVDRFREGVWWVWMHNDWLEILFTLGTVGFALSVLTFWGSLKRLYLEREYSTAMALVLFGLTMGMNFPLHHPIGSLFGAWLVLYGLMREPNKMGETRLSL